MREVKVEPYEHKWKEKIIFNYRKGDKLIIYEFNFKYTGSGEYQLTKGRETIKRYNKRRIDKMSDEEFENFIENIKEIIQDREL